MPSMTRALHLLKSKHSQSSYLKRTICSILAHPQILYYNSSEIHSQETPKPTNYISPPSNTSSPLATKTHKLTIPPTTIPIKTPPTHALLLAAVTCASLANRTTHPAFFPRPGIQASHQQLSKKPVNWIAEIVTTKTALAVARSLPRRRVRTARTARRVLGRRWEISRRREWRWER